MATRRRSSGFTPPKDEETKSIEEFLDANAREMFETISREEEEAEAKTEVVEATPFIPMEIVPTEDAGPRFVEDPVILTPPTKAPSPVPQLQSPPKRHPRNIPKFTRHK